MSDYSEKVCEACQPDADPATKEEINEVKRFKYTTTESCSNSK